jgi:hypothetical protein
MKTRNRRLRCVVLVVVGGLTLGLGGGATYAAFSWTTSNGSNYLATDTDWVAPAGASVIATTTSTTGGYISKGSSYRVYANATDTGNPASGVASVTANVSAITTGQTSVALAATGGPWSVGGVSYSYRSGALTANDPLSPGPTAYTLRLTDGHSPANSRTQTFAVIVENSAPAGADVQANVGNGVPDAGDIIVFTYSEPMDPASILAGWTGSGTGAQVLFRNGDCGANDSATVLDAGGGNGVHLGTVCVGDVVNGNRTFAASTMALSGAAVTVTLGGNPAGTKAASNTTLGWIPSALATDIAGNAASTAATGESGALDTDF